MGKRSKNDAETGPECNLNFGAGAGDPAPCFSQRTDGGGGSHGLWQDHCHQLVSEPAQADGKCSTFSALSRMEGTAFLLAALSVRHSRFKPVCIL
jgi:hypothetical protein